MAKRLRENLSSAYFEAANKMASKRGRRRIIAYVESYDDVLFWRSVLSGFENDKLYFQVMLPSRTPHLERGKKAVLMSTLRENVGKDMIACVDADYDYLIQGATDTSRTVIYNHYVFHTYAYAIENFQCYAPALHDTCVMVTLNDHDIFDFNDFLKRFSETVYPLFVWNIMFYRTPHYGGFTITDFIRIIETGNINLFRINETLAHLKNKIDTKLRQLQRNHPKLHLRYAQTKADLRQLGVTPENTYMFIQGHHLFDKVVAPLVARVCEQLVREREQEISRQSLHYTQRKNELSSYANSIAGVSEMLKKNMGYKTSPQFQRIQADIEAFLREDY